MSRYCHMRVAVAPSQRRGLSIVYVVLALALLVGFASLAVDVGRVRLARAQIQTAADAAARAGAFSLPVDSYTVIDQSSVAADSNQVIDTETSDADHLGARTNPGLELDDVEDIEFGIWDKTTRTFTQVDDDDGTTQDERRRANAVRAIGRRIQDRNNPVPLILAPVVGVFSSDIEREAIAHITGGPDKFGFVGLDWIKVHGGSVEIDSLLLPSLTRRSNGWLGSNGNINLGNSNVYGDVRPGIGMEIIRGPGSQITGWLANLSEPLVYPPAVAPTSNVTVVSPPPKKNDPYTIAGSNDPGNPRRYVLNGKLDHPDPLLVNGYAIIYVKGDVNVQGSLIINTGSPPNPSALEIRVVGNRNVTLGGGSIQYVHIYAPESNVTVQGTPNYYGWIIGKSLTFIGGSLLHYDESRDNNQPYKITLVK